ncbi:hypothetical protein AAVH_04270 [Aphelenchoides avenae]|nr:hypothetical protein AAVH_04270 [Aphelenchus avenae]
MYRHESEYPPSKRARVRPVDDGVDPTNPNPSIVVHVRNLSPKATEADLLEALSHFGPIAYSTCMPNKRMALVEFEDLEAARKCVVFAQSNPIDVAGQPALFNYSTSQFIQRLGLESEHPNKVLILTIYNAQYAVNVDVIQQICAPHGTVLRIAMIKRSMLQALVEFDSVESAKKTKHAINGADIYSGCCTIKVEFAKPDHVKVTKNDHEQWDYTSQGPSHGTGRRALLEDQRPPGPPVAPPYGASGASEASGYGGYPPRDDRAYPPREDRGYAPPPPRDYPPSRDYPPRDYPAHDDRYPPAPRSDDRYPPSHEDRYPPRDSRYPPREDKYDAYPSRDYPPQRDYPPPAARGGMLPPPAGDRNGGGYPPARGGYDAYPSRGEPPSRFGAFENRYGYESQGGRGFGDRAGYGCVMMMYGVNQEDYNCDKVFNLLCQYGNVMKVKFLLSKTDTVMVQMGTPAEVGNVLRYLQEAEIFGTRLTFRPSKQDVVTERGAPFQLSDNTPSFKDFSMSRLQRFSTPEMAARNRLVYPSSQLHWYNTPPTMTEERLMKIFEDKGGPVPEKVTIFQTRSERSSAGVADFGEANGAEKALKALLLVNHTPIHEEGNKLPFILKLAFADARAANPHFARGGSDPHGLSRHSDPHSYDGVKSEA